MGLETKRYKDKAKACPHVLLTTGRQERGGIWFSSALAALSCITSRFLNIRMVPLMASAQDEIVYCAGHQLITFFYREKRQFQFQSPPVVLPAVKILLVTFLPCYDSRIYLFRNRWLPRTGRRCLLHPSYLFPPY